MQLCKTRFAVPGVAAGLPLRVRTPRFVLAAARRPDGWRSQPSRQRSWEARVAEEAEVSSDAPNAGGPPEPRGALERAKAALDAEDLDREELSIAVAELEMELQGLRDSLDAADLRLASAQASLSTSKDQMLRLTADFDNFRRRTAAQSTQLTQDTRGDVIKQLLPIVDGFEQARTQVKAETEGEQKINNSYQGLYKQMVDLMRSLGVEPVPTVGSQFDPEVHEAIMREPSSEHPDGTVLVEFRKGFRIGDKLLRPAMVQVSFQEDAPVDSSEE